MNRVIFTANELSSRDNVLAERVEKAILAAAADLELPNFALTCRITVGAHPDWTHVNISGSARHRWVVAFGFPVDAAEEDLRRTARAALWGCVAGGEGGGPETGPKRAESDTLPSHASTPLPALDGE